MRASNVELRPVEALKPNPRNARTHSQKQLRQIARSIEEFGFVNPVLIDGDGMLIAGHGRLAAAKQLGMETVPTIEITGLNEPQKRKLMLADNRIAANAGWDRALLAIELKELVIEGSDIDLLGFEVAEVDEIILDHDASSASPDDESPEPKSGPTVSKTGDLWCLGKHRILCGSALDDAAVIRLCEGVEIDMVFTDPPYNLRVADLVGRGKRKHCEFAMASGEMSDAQFREFLCKSLELAIGKSREGALHYICIDWRHIDLLLALCRELYGDITNLCVWVKNNAGQGSFYRSRHEMVVVARVGHQPYRNNIELGKHGRNRSNVWEYAGVNSFRRERLNDLSMHPTVKPVAMIADAIKDCTRRGDFVLDPFTGSGSTLIACEKVGRRARLLEIDPQYVDVSIRRWQQFTGKDAIHSASGKTFDELQGALNEDEAASQEEASR